MKKLQLLLLVTNIMFVLPSCVTKKYYRIDSLERNNPIEIAINDFVNTSDFFKMDSIFNVDVIAYHGEYFQYPDSVLDSVSIIICISNFYQYNKLFFDSTKYQVGNYEKYFPTSYKYVDGKLFFWNDNKIPVNKELLDILFDYKLLDNERDNEVISTKGVKMSPYYFFCKNNVLILVVMH